jgi:DNA-binding NarL/FixJ family response regulator
MTVPNGAVLVRALALERAKDSSSQEKQFLIMLEHIAERQGIEAGKERYCLTDREWQVTQALAQGFTNKEIGNALRIAEPTVKSHMKNIMQKMKCTTRTAIVSQLAGSLVCGSA